MTIYLLLAFDLRSDFVAFWGRKRKQKRDTHYQYQWFFNAHTSFYNLILTYICLICTMYMSTKALVNSIHVLIALRRPRFCSGMCTILVHNSWTQIFGQLLTIFLFIFYFLSETYGKILTSTTRSLLIFSLYTILLRCYYNIYIYLKEGNANEYLRVLVNNLF